MLVPNSNGPYAEAPGVVSVAEKGSWGWAAAARSSKDDGSGACTGGLLSTEDAMEEDALTLPTFRFEVCDCPPDLWLANLRELGSGNLVGMDRAGGAVPPDLFLAVSLYLAVPFF